MYNQQAANSAAPILTDFAPILFHDGCSVCLDIVQTLIGTIPGLNVVNLGLNPELKALALANNVAQLPSLVVGHKVLPIAPHSEIDHIGL